MHFLQQALRITAPARLRHGHKIVDVDMPSAGQIGFFAEAAYRHRIGLAFFKNPQQAVALRALHFVHLFYKAVDVGQCGAQHAQCGKCGRGFAGRDFAQHAAGNIAVFRWSFGAGCIGNCRLRRISRGFGNGCRLLFAHKILPAHHA